MGISPWMVKRGRAPETYKIEKKRYEDNFDDVFARCWVDWCSHISFVELDALPTRCSPKEPIQETEVWYRDWVCKAVNAVMVERSRNEDM
jgi:hypothetical protein